MYIPSEEPKLSKDALFIEQVQSLVSTLMAHLNSIDLGSNKSLVIQTLTLVILSVAIVFAAASLAIVHRAMSSEVLRVETEIKLHVQEIERKIKIDIETDFDQIVEELRETREVIVRFQASQ